MTADFLDASLAGDRDLMDDLLGAAVSPEWPDYRRVVQQRAEELRAEPDLRPWLLRAIVLRAERRMVGHIGFHTRPGQPYLDALAPGGVEFGYTVFPADRRRGYAREACLALMDWAYLVHGVTRFVVSVSPDNAPSLALVRGLDFEKVGAHVDEEDGPEDIFARHHVAPRS